MGWDDGAREGWGWGWGWGWAGRGSFGSGERVWRAGRGRKRRESQRRGGTDGRMDGVGRWLRAASVEEEEEEVVEEARLWCWCWCWLPGADSAVVVRCCKEDAGNVGDWAVWMHAGGGGWVGGSDWYSRGGIAGEQRWPQRRRRLAAVGGGVAAERRYGAYAPRASRSARAGTAAAMVAAAATTLGSPPLPLRGGPLRRRQTRKGDACRRAIVSPPLASGDGSEHPSLPSSLPPPIGRVVLVLAGSV